ncbi:hypothetical protein HDG40_005662 [Paraburkholderia sp. JPY158]|uniref:Uncharacterized protein n=1 Tax=Paraburkholderia atlantica TaxID=2654982 RepID=A0A7W8QBS4_PARAM|nr:hypothetical protein [Paraburkholderia atlantica]MBB5427483.1 hypothetical protein [Paraburkholderia atlantica]
MLKISIFDGEAAAPDTLIHLCDIDGSDVPNDQPPFSVLEETLRVLEMCRERCIVPRLGGRCFTVAIGRKAGSKVTPLVRLDGYAHQGWASAHVIGRPPSWSTEPVYYSPDDDAVEIVRKLLAAQFAR